MSDETQPPLGEQFRHVYLERGKPTQDSGRMRIRLYALLRPFALPVTTAGVVIARRIEAEVGVAVSSRDLDEFFRDADITDLLSAITAIYAGLDRYDRQQWLADVRRTFQEENLGYRIDDAGGVHPFEDEEFERNRVSAIEALADPRYATVLGFFESAHQALEDDPPHTRRAIRDVFEAVETLFKLFVDGTPTQLNKANIQAELSPKVAALADGNDDLQRSASKMVRSLTEWVEATHFYRHGPGEKEPTPPPMDYAILMVSAGGSYLRWLARLDSQANSAKPAAM